MTAPVPPLKPSPTQPSIQPRRQAGPPRRIDWWRVLGCALVLLASIMLALLVWLGLVLAAITWP